MKARRNVDPLLLAQDALNRALDYDPEFARAHARLAIVDAVLARTMDQSLYSNRPFITSDARYHVEQALKRAPRLSEAHLAQGHVLLAEAPPAFSYDRVYKDAKAAFEKAISLDPSNYEALLQLAYLDVEFGKGHNALD